MRQSYLFICLATAAFGTARHLDAAPQNFSQNAKYETCFTPGMACEAMIVSRIAQAKRQLYIQAYSFTSRSIAEALIDAKKRGVEVIALLDKSQRTGKYSGATFLANAGIPLRIDSKVTIAHNKVIVIDGSITITGSFNFTSSAQMRNAENVIFIDGELNIAKQYIENFMRRWNVSEPW